MKEKHTDEVKRIGILLLASLSRIQASDKYMYVLMVQMCVKIILNLHQYFKILFFVDSSTYLCMIYFQNRRETMV